MKRSELDPLGWEIEKIWINQNPKLVKSLKRRGLLYPLLKEKQEEVASTFEMLMMKQGWQPQEAKDWVMRELTQLPQETPPLNSPTAPAAPEQTTA